MFSYLIVGLHLLDTLCKAYLFIYLFIYLYFPAIHLTTSTVCFHNDSSQLCQVLIVN